MRIEKVETDQFGPLENVSWEVPGVAVIFDDNMTGKTSLVDLLINILFTPRRGSRLFEGYERFSVENRDTVIKVLDGGRTYEFRPEVNDTRLGALFGWKEESLFRLLCIRAGDNRLVTDAWNRKSIINAVASLISGARTGELERIKSELVDRCGITEGGDWSNRKDTNPPKIKDKVRREMVPFLNNFQIIEDQLRELKDVNAELERTRSDVRKMRERIDKINESLAESRVNNLKKLTERISQLREELNNYLHVDRGTLDRWEEVKKKIEGGRSLLKSTDFDGYSLEEKLAQVKQKESEKKRRLSSKLDEEISQTKRRLRRLREEEREVEADAENDRRQALDFVHGHIYQTIADLRQKKRRLEELKGWTPYRSSLGVLFGGTLILGTVVFLVMDSVFANFGAIILTFFGISGAAWLVKLSRGEKRLEARIESLKRRVEKDFYERFSPLLADRVYDVDKIDQLAPDLPEKVSRKVKADGNLTELKEEIAKLRKKLEELRREEETLPDEVRDLREREKNLGKRKREAEQKIRKGKRVLSELREKTGVKTVQVLEKKLSDKLDLKSELAETKNLLIAELDLDNDELDKVLAAAREEIQRLTAKKVRPENKVDVDDLGNRRSLREERDHLREELDEKENKLERLTETAGEIRSELRERGTDSTSPGEVYAKRENYLDELTDLTLDRLAGLLSRRTLDRVSREYVKTLDKYLKGGNGRSGEVSELFSEVMGEGFDVEFDFEDDEFIIHEGGLSYKEGSLSSGGRKHLFYATRLALLREISPEPAFLVLDDPFLIYHRKRKRRAIEQLKRFADDGWQILCFTVDRETRDAFVGELGAQKLKIGDLRGRT